MKKSLLVLLVVAVLSGMFLTACGAPVAQPTTAPAVPATAVKDAAQSGAKSIIAVSLPSLDNPLMLGFQDSFKKGYGDKYDVQVASADGNANTQATQVENFTAMKPKFMFVMPVESTSLVPKLDAARQAGVTVLVAGGDPGNPDAYDTVMMMNQYLAGWYEAYMAKQWIDKTYPNAADGSIETAIFESTLNTEAAARSAGEKMIAEPYLKNAKGEYIDATGKVVTEADKVPNPAYSPKVKVVQTVQAEMFQAGQTAMQNILTTNPNVKVVLAYAGDGGMGASKALLDDYAKGPGMTAIDDLNKVAVFGVGMIGPEGQAVMDSASNKSVFRGTIRFGGDLVGRTQDIAGQMLNGTITKVIYDPLDIVTLIDGKLMATPIDDTEVFKVPTAAPAEVKLAPPP